MKTDEKIGDPILAIGGIRLSGRAILAPMSGVTDMHMRRLAARFGAGLVVSEMVASEELAQGDEEARLRAEGTGVTPHVVQIAGCDPGWMARGAQVAEAGGADVIDINMGCPAKRVTGGWAGSALMRDLDHAVRLVEAVVAAVRVPVTVKMRLGWDESSLNAPDLARRAVEAGAQAITVHGRTRQQFYKGQANPAAVAPVVGAVGVPVVVNGDIATADDARTSLARSGAAAVMVGRAALGRPWLVGGIARALAGEGMSEPPAGERAAAAVEHYEGMLSLYGRRMGVRHARKHLAAYAEHGGGLDAPERARLVTTEDPAEAVRLLSRAFHETRREAA